VKKLIEVEGEFAHRNILVALKQYIDGVANTEENWIVGRRLIQLALRSAARAVPLIAVRGNLSFWGDSDNQIKQLAKLFYTVIHVSTQSYPAPSNYLNLLVDNVDNKLNGAASAAISLSNSTAAANTDIGMPDASITTIASSSAVISDLDVSFGYLDCRFVDEWKQDFQHMQLSGDLWGEPLWRPLSDSYRKEIHRLFAMVDTLREQQVGASEEWKK
jgi:hypothetical protein